MGLRLLTDALLGGVGVAASLAAPRQQSGVDGQLAPPSSLHAGQSVVVRTSTQRGRSAWAI